MESKKQEEVQMNLQSRSTVTDVENKHSCQRIRWGGINWEIGIDIYTLLYIKQITNKDLLHSTGNSTQNSVLTYMGKESKSGYMYMHN